MKLQVKFSEKDMSVASRFIEVQTIHGRDGEDGKDGYTPQKNIDYFDGKDGAAGQDGKSAYEVALDNGFEGSEAEWLESLHGADGQKGDNGKDGYTPIKGTDYYTEADKAEMVSAVLAELPFYDGTIEVV